MRAAWKWVLGAIAATITLMVIGVGGQALAQSCCTPPPTCCTPPSPPPTCCTPPSPPTPPSTPCCTPPGHSITVPGVNVNVNASVIVNAAVNAQVNAQAASVAGGSAYGQTIVVGGGGGYGGGLAPGPTVVTGGLNVEGGKEMRRVAYQAQRTKTIRVVIQAFCVDDKLTPHPASQVFADQDVADDYNGEIYRCIAGTRMQYTWAEYLGQVSFEGGKTITCEKNQSLWHAPGGKLECRTQKPERDCNERSLLRRFGAGIKILTMTIVETYTAYREEEVESASSSASSFSFSGGVGGFAY